MKIILKRLLCLLCALITLVSFCSCGNSGKISDKEITSLIDSYLELMRYLGVQPPECEDWDDAVTIDGYVYFAVTDESLDTWDEWESYIYSIVCGDLADYAINHEGFANVDGYLFVRDGSMGYDLTDDYTYEILSNGGGEATVEVTNPDVSGEYEDIRTLTFTLTDDGWRISG